MRNDNSMRAAFVRWAVFFGGLFYVLTALALLFAPQWFFDNVGTYAPFNRHYEGDLGAVILPLGLGLMLASRNPARHRLMIGVGVAASVIHAVNHLYDSLTIPQPSVVQALPATLQLFVFAAVLAAAYFAIIEKRQDEHA